MNPIDLIHQAIDKANSSPQFKKNKLIASIEENMFNNQVDVLINGKSIIAVKAANLTNALVEVEKWLLIAALPIYNNLNIIEENGEFKIIAK